MSTEPPKMLRLRSFTIQRELDLRLSSRSAGVDKAKSVLMREYLQDYLDNFDPAEIGAYEEDDLAIRTIYLTPELDEQLKERAASTGFSKSEIIRAAMISRMGEVKKAVLDEMRARREAETARARALVKPSDYEAPAELFEPLAPASDEEIAEHMSHVHGEEITYEAVDEWPCWCPCGCGCTTDPSGPCGGLNEDGLCHSCADGMHEIPPDGVKPGLEKLLAAAESYVKQLKEVIEKRSLPTVYAGRFSGIYFDPFDTPEIVRNASVVTLEADVPKKGSTVRTLTVTYGAPQKQQRSNFTKIPAGSVGSVRHVGRDDDSSVYALVIFKQDGKKLFAKIAPSALETVT